MNGQRNSPASSRGEAGSEGKADSSLSLPRLPEHPMAPITSSELPKGDDWGYQLKWDGVRIIARIQSSGTVQLYSRNMLNKNSVYPEVVRLLSSLSPDHESCILDGEVVWWDGVRPNFQEVLKRERSRSGQQAAVAQPSRHTGSLRERPLPSSPSSEAGSIVYVLFDLLADESGDLRHLPYRDRHERLKQRYSSNDPRLIVTDLFMDGEALWRWVESKRWEGVVSKRLSSPYAEGKKHRDWFKKKTALVIDVDIVGLKWRSGIIASLVMAYHDAYFGSVSLGLNAELRQTLASTFRTGQPETMGTSCPFPAMPDDLKRETIQWLPLSFKCRVTGLEITAAGQLRHPKLVTFLPKEPIP
ncbi:DNA ligase [Paenibacillus oenotherae]|uniref:DNA ligase n=1 Tax=Paenibacillus oenotherae TaxID=1435645 RepID=A0ABS7D9Q0_9BACL|nr:DNA ligase [Paenibacillus oenotherae]MBW7476488.1 DNA ligase [Paenibacillus oenotherae]